MAATQLPSEGLPSGNTLKTGISAEGAAASAGLTDSAGFPWEGRTFDHHGTAFADDDGSAPETVMRAIDELKQAADVLTQIRENVTAADSNSAAADDLQHAIEHLAARHAETIAVCSTVRFLIPLIAEAGDYGVTEAGRVVEKSQELSIVTVAAPDGRKVLPVFTSTESMKRWNDSARPIPVPGPQVAIAAAQEETDLIIVDPGSPKSEFGIRRSAFEAFALGKEIVPAWADSAVYDAYLASIVSEPAVISVILAPGDPFANLTAPEVRVGLQLKPGLSREQLDSLVSRLQQSWAVNQTIASRVDSMSLQLTAGGA